MAVKIRLKRIGAKKTPFYRIVVADARSPRDGRQIDQLELTTRLQSQQVENQRRVGFQMASKWCSTF